jgi:hypothetical protein
MAGRLKFAIQRRATIKATVAIALMLMLMSGAMAASASAFVTPGARFVWESCDPALPGGNPPPGQPPGGGLAISFFDTCAQQDGSIGIQQSGDLSSAFSFWLIEIGATPGGFVESETISGGTAALGPGNDHTFVYENGWPGPNLGETQRTFLLRSAAEPGSANGGAFSISWNCDGNYAPGCGAGPTVWADHIAVTEVDPTPPELTVEGPLLASGVVRGHQAISAAASDLGGGVSRIEALVNGLPAAAPTVGACAQAQVSNASVRGTVALSPTPCPPTLAASWSLDTGAPPFQQGANTVQACASDFATIGEANRTCSTPSTITVDDSCTESSVPGGQDLSADFAGNHKETRTVGYGKGAEVTGELSDDAGDAISGATICVEMQQQGSAAAPVPVGTATTDSQGHFDYAIRPGANRRVEIGYRHDSFQVARSVDLYTHTRPTIHISPGHVSNGDSIRISGKVPGGQLAARRVVVVKAGSLGSKKMYPFGETTTNGKGEWHIRYTFAKTTRKTIYKMEAFVPTQDDFPWEAGHSKAALVEVRK